MELRQLTLNALCIADPLAKCSAVQAMQAALAVAVIDTEAAIAEPHGVPGRPERPALVPPRDVPMRSAATPAGRAALLHAVAHIEFNAINLALDAVWRFAGLPEAFYRDWAQVAAEEAQHFALLRAHLNSLGHDYGDFAAHDGLWQMAWATRGDFLARMALVPRTLEARGLDATPPMQRKFAQAGDHRAAEILGVILRDEVGHVAIGNHWYRFACARAGLDAESHYPVLATQYRAPRLHPPFNWEARRQAGFSARELQVLAAGSGASAPE